MRLRPHLAVACAPVDRTRHAAINSRKRNLRLKSEDVSQCCAAQQAFVLGRIRGQAYTTWASGTVRFQSKWSGPCIHLSKDSSKDIQYLIHSCALSASQESTKARRRSSNSRCLRRSTRCAVQRSSRARYHPTGSRGLRRQRIE